MMRKPRVLTTESTDSTSSDGTRLKQVSLQGSVEMRKIWDINDFRVKRIHSKVEEMIAIDCQPVSILDHVGFKSLVTTLEPKYQMPSESILEQKMALAAYSTENSIAQLTPVQLELAKRIVLVLSPVEEVTKSISKETATLSVVIPNIRALLWSWEKQDDQGIRTMKEEMIKSLRPDLQGLKRTDSYQLPQCLILVLRISFLLAISSKQQ